MKLLFGKYKGKEFSEIPEDYLAWLIKKEVLREPYRTELRMWLLEEKQDELIQLWMLRHFQAKNCGTGCYSPDPDGMDYCPPDFYFEGDLFDVMQGCGLNGD